METMLPSSQSTLICLVTSKFNPLEVRTPDSIKGVMQSRIDHMNEVGQMVVKTAAILGFRFPRRMLNAMMPRKVTPGQLQKCFEMISHENIFACAAAFTNMSGTNLAQGMKSKFTCHCNMPKPIAERNISDCKWLCFRSATLQETAYEMYTEGLRRNIHIKAARYMETNAHRCTACGGGEFLSPFAADDVNTEGQSWKRHSLVTKEPVSKLRKNVLLSNTRSSAPSTGRRSSIQSEDDRTYRSQPNRSIYSSGAKPEAEKLLESSNSQTKKSGSAGVIILEKSSEQIKLPPELVDDDEEDTTPIIDRVIRRRLTIPSKTNLHAPMTVDKRECTCARILLEVYPQLVRHWKAAGNLEKTVHFLIESAAAAIALDENLQVRNFTSI